MAFDPMQDLVPWVTEHSEKPTPEEMRDLVVRQLEAEIASKGWHQHSAPYLGIIECKEINSVGATVMAYSIKPMPTPLEFQQNPVGMLSALAELMMTDRGARLSLAMTLNKNFAGLVFSSEAWSLMSVGADDDNAEVVHKYLLSGGGVEGLDQLPISDYEKGRLRAALTNAIDEHPDKVETRIVYAAFVDGGVVHLTRVRAKEGLDEITVHQANMDDGESMSVGAIADSMATVIKVLRTVLGLTPNGG